MLIFPITNGVDISKFRRANALEKQQLRRQLSIPKKRTIVTYAGRLVSYKGLPLLLRVAEAIQRECKEVGFVLIGSGGIDIHNCETELKEFVRAKCLEEAVYFPGEVGNVHEYLQASDIFVLPSEEDAFPAALVEAMACGLPVVSTPVGGIKEIITDRHDGLLVEAGDFQQLHDRIRALIFDRTLSDSLGRAAVRTVHERYSSTKIADEYCEVFRRVHSGCLVSST
jgi:glycosyltransferase involved in cell wall biosynthesis